MVCLSADNNPPRYSSNRAQHRAVVSIQIYSREWRQIFKDLPTFCRSIFCHPPPRDRRHWHTAPSLLRSMHCHYAKSPVSHELTKTAALIALGFAVRLLWFLFIVNVLVWPSYGPHFSSCPFIRKRHRTPKLTWTFARSRLNGVPLFTLKFKVSSDNKNREKMVHILRCHSLRSTWPNLLSVPETTSHSTGGRILCRHSALTRAGRLV